MSIEAIKSILPPPHLPLEIPTQNILNNTENILGFNLPVEYKYFLENYGSGSINDFLWIFNPSAKNQNIELLWQAKIRIQALTELRSEGEIIPYNLHPAKGGIFPFAATDNGDTFFWKIDDSGAINSTVINEGRSSKCEEFFMPWGDFLFGLISGKINSKILPRNVFQGHPFFQPAN